jgi:hypothetical protein
MGDVGLRLSWHGAGGDLWKKEDVMKVSFLTVSAVAFFLERKL